MLEYLKELDIKLLLLINGSHTPFMDELMWWITHRFFWIPMYVAIIVFLFVKKRQDFWMIIILIVLAMIAADQFASSLIKPWVLRLRPCHDDLLRSSLYVLEGMCGGKYGFISSHASTTFTLATFLSLLLGKEYRWVYTLFAWAALVSVSRVYLAVHYPGDVLSGALAGIIIGSIFYTVYAYRKLSLS